MFKILAHDTVNDIALMQTTLSYYVRYGLDQHKYGLNSLHLAVDQFKACQIHALTCEGHFPDYSWDQEDGQ